MNHRNGIGGVLSEREFEVDRSLFRLENRSESSSGDVTILGEEGNNVLEGRENGGILEVKSQEDEELRSL